MPSRVGVLSRFIQESRRIILMAFHPHQSSIVCVCVCVCVCLCFYVFLTCLLCVNLTRHSDQEHQMVAVVVSVSTFCHSAKLHMVMGEGYFNKQKTTDRPTNQPNNNNIRSIL